MAWPLPGRRRNMVHSLRSARRTAGGQADQLPTRNRGRAVSRQSIAMAFRCRICRSKILRISTGQGRSTNVPVFGPVLVCRGSHRTGRRQRTAAYNYDCWLSSSKRSETALVQSDFREDSRTAIIARHEESNRTLRHGDRIRKCR